MDTKSETLRHRNALQCAKAALLLASLKDHTRTTSSSVQDIEVLEMERLVRNLKVELAKERIKMREVKLCGVMEMLIQVMVLFSVWSFVLILAFS